MLWRLPVCLALMRTYQCDSEGTALNYEVISDAISAVRCSVPLGSNWKKRIDEDFKKRGNRK